jgi:asparagine synthase (glutamine-hydrolysing)
MVSDVPVGVMLSGGLDSSILASLHHQNTDIQTFNIGFREKNTTKHIWLK